jgi:acetyl-CoA C-acetyltransferase
VSANVAATPVVVGVGTSGRRSDDPAAAPDAIGLMIEAAMAAADDCGQPQLLGGVDQVVVPRGSWSIADPGRHVAAALGATGAQTVLGDLGVLQHTLLADACSAVAAGRARSVLVVGAEARHRDQLARRLGVALAERPGLGDGAPDRFLRPANDVLHPTELQARLYQAVVHYALIEDACRRAGHPSDLDRLWRDAAAAAATNEWAWVRDAPPERPATERMLSTPYRRNDSTQWNVDQGAALLITSAEVAAGAGIPADEMTYPLVAAESNTMVPLVARAEPARCQALGVIGTSLEELLGFGLADIDAVDLYSCFPTAVAIQQRELGVSADRPHTITGGMALAGGPFNNYVLQSTVAMIRRLRSRSDATGLVTCVSGMLTKQGAMVWSNTPQRPFVSTDVSARAAAVTPVVDVAGLVDTAPHEVEAETIEYGPESPLRTVTLGRNPDGQRVLALTS